MILKNNRKLQHLNQCGERESRSVMVQRVEWGEERPQEPDKWGGGVEEGKILNWQF